MRGDYDGQEDGPILRGRAIPTCVGTTWVKAGKLRAYKRAIPTCVGTTDAEVDGLGGAQGHPHVRGDYFPG